MLNFYNACANIIRMQCQAAFIVQGLMVNRAHYVAYRGLVVVN